MLKCQCRCFTCVHNKIGPSSYLIDLKHVVRLMIQDNYLAKCTHWPTNYKSMFLIYLVQRKMQAEWYKIMFL